MGGQVKCTNFCEKTPQKPASSVCGIVDVAHSTDYPYPGWAWKHSFDFLLSASKAASARQAAQGSSKPQQKQQQELAKKKEQAPAVKKVTANSSTKRAAAGRNLLLQMTYQGEQQLPGRQRMT
jgi:hypothetical protein